MMTSRAVVLHPGDDIAVMPVAVGAGVSVAAGLVTAAPIPAGHKVARHAIAVGSVVRKFGQTIGVASADIAAGDHVHVHNLQMIDGARDLRAIDPWVAPLQPDRHFDGFVRDDGRVGTRNYVGILTSVNCSASVARFIADAVERSGMLDAWPSIDGIVPIAHTSGCGMADRGEGHDLLQRTLWGYAANPNFGAVLMVGLGCEVLQIARFKQAYGLTESDRFQTMTIQGEGGTRAAVAAGVERVRAMLPLVGAAQRTPVSAGTLVLALQCGGSDGYSGFTANPALGSAADRLVALGGTVILSETPEIYGAEHLLIDRAASPAVADALRAKLAWWEEYCARHGAAMDNNPSPGNKAGGLTTILEKSLGAVAKGGTAPLCDVIGYAEPLRRRGLVFMDSPGFDPCSATGQVASGATMLCFTTGRGSVFGCKPTPSLKLATNTPMFARMRDDMDIDCGTIATGGCTIDAKGEEIFDSILAAASGAPTRSEALGMGGAEFVPWHIGAVM